MEKRVQSERESYNVVWRDMSNCKEASPNEEFARFFFDGFKGEVRVGQSLTHFGCGTARVAKQFIRKGLNVSLVDISPYCLDEEIRHMLTLFSHQIHFNQACLWNLSKEVNPSHWIYCCHALEHIPDEKVDIVLAQIAERMCYGGYFSICLRESAPGNHSSFFNVRGREYWEEKICQHFRIVGVDAIADDAYFNPRVACLHKLG